VAAIERLISRGERGGVFFLQVRDARDAGTRGHRSRVGALIHVNDSVELFNV
jgi:hypothetical protein